MQLSERYALLTAALAFTVTCGGKAVIDGDGSGGDGNGGVTTSGGGATNNAGGAPNGPGQGPGPGPGVGGSTPGICVDATFGLPRPQPGDCQAACEIFLCCSVQECAGLDPDEREGFLSFCVPSCEQQMALVAIVNGEACDQTVSTVRGVSEQFADICDNGVGP